MTNARVVNSGDLDALLALFADSDVSNSAEPERARQYGRTGRQRCIDEFSWAHIAEQTLEIYRKVTP